MQFLFAGTAAVISVIFMFVIAKIVGYRQISELSMYDYINSITLGSIAADLAITSEKDEAIKCLIAMAIYGIFTVAFSYVSMKSKSARRVLVGTPIVLMEKGKIFKNSFKKAKLDLDEFLSMCRVAGYFDPSKIDTVIMEPSGNISVIPKSANRPLTPEDMSIPANREPLIPNVIMDGQIMDENLQLSGHDKNWLNDKLKLQGIKQKDVFLAVVDSNDELFVFEDYNKDKDSPL